MKVVVLAGLIACAPRGPRDDARRYLADAEFRRAELVASLVAPDNGYSRARLERYARWEQLPAWNPPVAELGDRGDARALDIDASARAGDRDALLALGEKAFFRYPAQLIAGLAPDDAARAADRYGLWRDGARVGGLVRVELLGGATAVAYTCASCHAAARDGRVVVGLGNDRFDIGRLVADAAHLHDPLLAAWGPGRADVSTLTAAEPVRFPDLRPTRYVSHLQVNATVAQRDLASLALRIETLLVTGHGEVVRPPREIALGLALYVWSLAPAGPARVAATPTEQRGRALFDARCAGCHAPPSFTGPPVAIERIGVDAIARSRERGTGTWRVPSLLGVRDRRALFHDGALATLAAVLDPRRLDVGYTDGRVPGAVVEHRFGLDLPDDARADLLAFLDTL
jgi:hypothetical protein